jgi:hypothetical protein
MEHWPWLRRPPTATRAAKKPVRTRRTSVLLSARSRRRDGHTGVPASDEKEASESIIALPLTSQNGRFITPSDEVPANGTLCSAFFPAESRG